MSRFAFFVALVPTVVGIVVVAASVTNTRTALSAESWPSVTGEVVGAESHQHSRYLGRNVSQDEFFELTTYRYTVAGSTYESSRIRPLGQPTRFETAEEAQSSAQRRYPVGSNVEVFYDPDNPSSALLERRIEPGNDRMLLVLGWSLVALGLVLGWLLRRLMPPRGRRERFFVCSDCQCELPAAELCAGRRCRKCWANSPGEG